MSRPIFSIKKIIAPLLLVMSLFYFFSCEYQNREDLFPPEDPCIPESVSFSEELLPTIETTCNISGCHNSNDVAAGIDLSNHEGVVQSIESNRFLGSINQEIGFSPMPKVGAKLSDCYISILQIWVDNGSQDN